MRAKTTQICSHVKNFTLRKAVQLKARLSSETGDVPGWVLITIMTAGIVIVLWAVAAEKLPQLFEDAIDGVKAPSE